MIGARRQLLAGLQRSRAQRQRLIGQLRPADGDGPTEALASETLELVSPDTQCHERVNLRMQLAFLRKNHPSNSKMQCALEPSMSACCGAYSNVSCSYVVALKDLEPP